MRKPKPTEITISDQKIAVEYVPTADLTGSEYNPRRFSQVQADQLKKSIKEFDLIDPLIVNSAPNRRNVIIGGHFRWKMGKELGIKELPVVYVNIPNVEKEKELNLRLNKNTGDWDWSMLSDFDENFLTDVGFSSEELDDIFDIEDMHEVFDLEKELRKLDITKIEIQKGDIYQLGNHRLMCGDSTVEADVLKLMDGEEADACLTDPPYILSYLQGKRHGNSTKGFGYKKDRTYLETEELPPDFTEKWMANINKIQKEDFNIIVYENWKNIPTIWEGMKPYWKVRNMLVWHLPNRTQGFAGKYRFFSKHDIAMVGTSGDVEPNVEAEGELLENEYETALYAISGKPHWESYGKGKRYCPTDFIEFRASDEKHSGQSIIFGTKPIEILIPYIKVLTKRGDLIIEPFGGSGSTLIAAEKLKRRCYLIEKSAVYCEVIKRRWEKLPGQKGVKIA